VENQFAEFEIMVIEKEVSRKSYQDIAFFLDRSVDDVREFIGEWIKNRGIIPYQQVLDVSNSERILLRQKRNTWTIWRQDSSSRLKERLLK
jgi:hypothetical protein